MSFIDFAIQQWPLLALLAGLIMAYSWTESVKSGESISAHQLTQLVNTESAVILDIRPAAEFKTGHLVDAINIPYEKLNSDIGSLEKYKTKTIIIVDKMGQYSGHIGKTLKKLGFNVKRLSGGISEWQSQNLPLVKSK